MTYLEYLQEQIRGPVTLVATATNGLDPRKDQLLAIALKAIALDGTEISNDLLIRTLDRGTILKSSEYHKISFDMATRLGRADEEIKEALKETTDTGLFFTYNPNFQSQFLDPFVQVQHMYDLPLLLKGAEMQLFLDTTEVSTLADLEKLFRKLLGKPPSLKNMCKFRDISEHPPFDVLPVVYGTDLLHSLWNLLINSKIRIQEELPGIEAVPPDTASRE